MSDRAASLLAQIKELTGVNLFNQDFLQTWDKSDEEIRALVLIAQFLQTLYNEGNSLKLWESGLAIANFRDKSTRTRFSFASAANMLGLNPQDFDEAKSQVSHGETVRETANMLSFCAEVIGIRDDLFVGQGHTYQLETGSALQHGFEEGNLAQRTTVVNLQSDTDHPTQSLSDLIHLKERFGDSWDSLKGKKICVSWGYSPSYGKPLSVPQALIGLLTRFGMDVTLAHPEGYELLPEIVDVAKKNAEKSGGNFKIVHSMKEGCQGVDVVYAKSWGSLELMRQRSALLEKGKAGEAALRQIEQDALKASEILKDDWEFNEEVEKVTNNAWYMHCLPADISGENCTHGEVSKEVFAKNRVSMYNEASKKPFVIAAMIVTSRLQNVDGALTHLLTEKKKRTQF